MFCIEKKLITLGQEEVLKHFVPEFMLHDKNFQGFIYALEHELQLISSYFELILLYVNLGKASEEILDELAWQFNIIEYDKAYPIETKRELVKGCLSIHHKRGTVAAVEDVATKVFGNAEIEEWFDYGGEPYHFRILTENLSSNDEMIEKVEEIVKKTQNVRSHLEEVVVEVMKQTNLYFGCAVEIISDVETFGVDMNI